MAGNRPIMLNRQDYRPRSEGAGTDHPASGKEQTSGGAEGIR
jgi:hypothetical protein